MNFRMFLEDALAGLDIQKIVKQALDATDWPESEFYFRAQHEIEDTGGEPDATDPEDIHSRAYELATTTYDDRFYAALHTFQSLGTSFKAVRKITVKADSYEQAADVIQTNKVGEFWSWDEYAASAHWGKFDAGYSIITLSAKVQQNQVDWEITMLMNVVDPEEKEIRLKSGSKVTIDGIRFGRQWYSANMKATV